MYLSRILLCLCLLLPFVSATGCAHATAAEHAASTYATQEIAAATPGGNLPDYSLPPDKLVKAQHLYVQRNLQFFVGLVWGIAQLLLLLWLGGIAWMRDTAVRVSRNRWKQGYLFLLLFVIATFLLDLPLRLYHHHMSLQYGFSIQGWASWFGDLGKTLLLEWLVGGLLVMLLFFIIRKFPRRWWLVFWAAAIPLILIGIFITPYVIDPLFNKFEPLQNTHPELVTQLERVVARGHMDIPPERMYLMKASAKVTTLNAYVTGFGASKRVVVWDTSIQKATPDEILFIFGHESGHYVLHHIVRGVLFGILLTFVSLYVGYVFVQWAIARYGVAWRVPSQEDWGTLAILLLAVTTLGALTGPLENAFSRNIEHAADVYGQEAVHGIVPDPQQSGQAAFQVLGENSLDLPTESPLIEFMMENHPMLGRRAAFAHAYDPWADGMSPKYFPK